MASRTPVSLTVLLTATSFVCGAGAIAAFRAASMRASMSARFSGMLMTAQNLARAAAGLNAGLLALMTDDERLPDPVRAALSLPKGSLVIVRSRDTKRRHALGEALRTQTHGLILLAADDPVLADRLHGLHLPEVHARDAAHWRVLR